MPKIAPTDAAARTAPQAQVEAAREGEVLAKILARKRIDVASRARARPLATFRANLGPSRRSLLAALRRPGPRFVLECKRASPSRGLIRPEFDAITVARAYAPLADAVSVLTDAPFFGGSFDILRTVREQVEVPVLCKDFVVNPYQVFEARSHGADAILIMMSALDDSTAQRCLQAADDVALDCLVEVHDEVELERALALGVEIIGINNRDLKTLTTDLSVTERLAPLVPSDRVVVSESGIARRLDVDRLLPFADGFLVGTSLMSQADIGDAARSLIFGRVKICGLTQLEAAHAARQAGARFGGLIFVGASPRAVSESRACELTTGCDLPWVGVFVDEAPQRVARLASQLRLVAVQLHGNEDDTYVSELRHLLEPPLPQIWKSVGVRKPEAHSRGPRNGPALVRALPAGVDRPLFDTMSGERSGGTGTSFPWSAVRSHPRLADSILAGGLCRANIVSARRVGAHCLDVNSGVEDQHGRKSPHAIASIFDTLRGRGRGDADLDGTRG